MRWIIVEDAMRDRSGHWLEYVTTFYDGLQALADPVEVLVTREAEPIIAERLKAKRVLPPSIWHRMGDGSSALVRYSRVPLHALRTWQVMRHQLRKLRSVDVVFVPTVSVHHLLGWRLLLRQLLQDSQARLLLFFINLPIHMDPATGKPRWTEAPSTRLLRTLLSQFAPAVRSGRVLLGAEPQTLQEAFAQLSGLPVVCFPQPVPVWWSAPPPPPKPATPLLMACYGAARAEKGSDILQSALLLHFRRFPDSNARFAIQWIDDFTNPSGQKIVKNPELLANDRVEFVTRYFENGTYPKRVAATNVFLLPYRQSSYALRGSRVAVEGIVHGIPIVATQGTSFARQMTQFGAGVCCQDENPASLAEAIRQVELNYDQMQQLARKKSASAQEHFSVKTFRTILAQNGVSQGDGQVHL